MHRRVSRVGLGEGVSLSANQSLREKLENDIKARPSVSKFATGSIRASPHGGSRRGIDQKSAGSAFSNSNRKSV